MTEFELVIPAYNEGPTLAELIRRTVEAATSSGYSPDTFQLILVNNGSSDETQQILEELSAGELGQWFRFLTVSPNRGYGNGLWQGLKTARGRYVGWSHADLQCDPKDAFVAANVLQQHHATKLIIKGARSGRNKRDIFVSRVFELLARLILGLSVCEINAQPKVMPGTIIANARRLLGNQIGLIS